MAWLRSQVLPLNGRGWVSPRGQLAIWTPASHILVLAMAGYGEAVFADHVVKAYGELAPDRPVSLFFDVENLENYHSALRVRITERLARDRERLAELSVLVRSTLVAMGVSVANLALRGAIRSHSTRAAFVGRLEAALQASRVTGFSCNVLLSAAAQLEKLSMSEQ